MGSKAIFVRITRQAVTTEAVMKTYREILRHYLDACYRGDGRACNEAGVMTGDGKGTDPDLEKSARLYKKACELGYGLGCRNYALRLERGKGVPLNISKAKYYYKKACRLGYMKAWRELSYL